MKQFFPLSTTKKHAAVVRVTSSLINSEGKSVTSERSSTKSAMAAILKHNFSLPAIWHETNKSLSRRFGPRRTKASLGDFARDAQNQQQTVEQHRHIMMSPMTMNLTIALPTGYSNDHADEDAVDDAVV